MRIFLLNIRLVFNFCLTVCPYAKTVALYPSKILLTRDSTHIL